MFHWEATPAGGDGRGYLAVLQYPEIEGWASLASDVWSQRESIRASIAAQLAASHADSWIHLSEADRGEYLADADALIDQGMTTYWVDPEIPAVVSPAMEAEVFAFDLGMAWFMDYLDARHPDWKQTGVMPASHIEEADPQEWDAWVSVAVTVSEVARRVWSQRMEAASGVPDTVMGSRAPLPAAAASAPPQVRGGGVRDRVIAAAGATLAQRHGRRWMDLPWDLKAAYVRDVESLISAGLMVLPD